jgi:lipid A 3-O-deacylase
MKLFLFDLRYFYQSVILLCLSYLSMSAQSLSYIFENDFFASRDRYYTVGHRLDYLPASLPIKRYSFGQQVYTPADISKAVPNAADRPYAAWLFFSGAWHKRSQDRSDNLELQLGVVGPAAAGEELMNFFHQIIGNSPAQGWAYQLKNEPGLLLAYERRHFFTLADLWQYEQSGQIYYGGEAGNISTLARLGGLWQWGLGAHHQAQITMTPAQIAEPVRQESAGQFGFTLFASIEGRAVLRNIFLDGNTFLSNSGVTKIPFICEISIGFRIFFGNLQLIYSQRQQSREFINQPYPHQFGSLAISYIFP